MVMHFQNHQDFNLAKLKHLDGVLRKTVCPSNYFIFRAPGKARPALICPIFPGKVSVETGIYIGMGFHEIDGGTKLKLQSQDQGKICEFYYVCGEEPLPSFQNLKTTVTFDERSRAAVI